MSHDKENVPSYVYRYPKLVYIAFLHFHKLFLEG